MNNNCPCGKIYLTKGSKYSRNGLYLELISGNASYKFDLVHDQDVELSSGRSFITSTPIITDNITIDSIAIKSENAIVLSDLLHIVIKVSPNTVLSYYLLGSSNQTTNFGKEIKLNIDPPILTVNSKIIVEMHSVCYDLNNNCCDKLPSLNLNPTSINLNCI